jgi:predicted transcriptional regulator
MEKMKCLKIADKWLAKILDGSKTLELRRTNCCYRGPIALGNTRTKKVEGYAYLKCCVEFPVDEMKKLSNLHQATEFIDEYAVGRKTLYAYELTNVRREPKPFAYSFSTGSWCFAPVDSTHYHLLLLPIESELPR